MNQKIKVFFIGWNANGEKALQKVFAQSEYFQVEQVFTPTGYATGPMKDLCKSKNTPCIDLDKSLSALKDRLSPEACNLLIVASFPWFLPDELTNIPAKGSINIHAGLLPKYRGMHPLNWALIKDESEIGVTVHFIDAGMDSGDVIEQQAFPIFDSDDINSVYSKATDLGGELLDRALNRIKGFDGKIQGLPQRDSQAIFAPKRTQENGRIKWTNRTRDIFNLVRALKTPYPNAFSHNKEGQKISIRQTFLSNNAGEVLAEVQGKFLISTGDGVILVETDQALKVGDILA